jgi:transcriptional regulator with XRE-family HTH domain
LRFEELFSYHLGMVEPGDLGKAIERLRGERKQRVCAERAGISPSSWSLYESGVRAPRKDMRARIARGLGVDVRVLDETAWQVRGERIAGEEAGTKANPAGPAAPVSSIGHAPLDALDQIDEHVNGVAHHLRELALLLNKKTPLTP